MAEEFSSQGGFASGQSVDTGGYDLRQRVLPTGVVTMMFTDIVNSMQMKSAMAGATAKERDGAYMQTIKQPHDGVVRSCTEKAGGHIIKGTGDGFFITFSDAEAAVVCALNIQQQLAAPAIPTPLGLLEVRIGLHTGSASAAEGDYVSAAADKAARVAAQATGGQVLISRQTHALVEQLGGAVFQQTSPVELKGIAGTEHLYVVSSQSGKSATPRVGTAGTVAPKKSLVINYAVAAAAALVLGGSVLWWAPWKHSASKIAGATQPVVAYPQPRAWIDDTEKIRNYGLKEGALLADGEWLVAKRIFYPGLGGSRSFRDVAVRVTFSDRIDVFLRLSGKSYLGRVAKYAQIGIMDASGNITNFEGGVDFRTDYVADAAHELVFAAQGDKLSLWLDGKEVATVRDGTLRAGKMQLAFFADKVARPSRIKKVEYGELEARGTGVDAAFLREVAALPARGALPENVNYAVKSSFLPGFLEPVPELSAKLKEPETRERKFEEVVKSAEQAAVLVLVY